MKKGSAGLTTISATSSASPESRYGRSRRLLIDLVEAVIDLITSVGMYLLLMVGGTVLFLIFGPVAGYIPYSDRPGPGWHSAPFSLSWEDFLGNTWFSLEWALFLALYAIPVGMLLFIVIRGLQWARVPGNVVALVGGVLAGLLSGYITYGVGWYIALGLPSIGVSMLLGAAFGSLLLPRLDLDEEGCQG